MRNFQFVTILPVIMLAIFFIFAVEKTRAQNNQNIFLNATECIDVETSSNPSNARLIVSNCSNSSTQMFTLSRNMNGGFALINTASGLCIDVPNGDRNDGTIIQQFPCNNSSEQSYLLSQAQNLNNQMVISGPINISHSGKCIDARFRPYLRQFACNNSANQNFQIKSFTSSQNTQSDAQFLNSWAADTKVKFPLTVGDIQITDAIVNTNANYLEIRGWTPRLPAGQQRDNLANALKPFLLTDYCNSGAVQRNIRVLSRTYDFTQTDGYIYWINPGDCPTNTVSNTPINVPLNPTNISTTNIPNQSSSVEDQYWNAVKSSTNATDFQGYLNNYPGGQYAAIARLRIGQLGGSVSNPTTQISNLPGNNSPVSPVSSVEQQYWDAVKNSSNAQDFQNYLRDYPSGQFVPIARLKISQLGGNRINNSMNNPTNNFSAEDQYWNDVRNSTNIRDIQSYLNIYPNGKYASIARLKINQLNNSTNNNNSPITNTNSSNRNRGNQILSKAQFGSLNELMALRKFWVMTETGDLESKQIITQELIKAFPKLIVANSEQDAEFFVLLSLTNEATGAIITGSSNPNNQTHIGEMMVFTATPGNNNVPNIRILFKTTKKQFFSANGGTFNRHPATNAAREFAKELQKINF